MSYVWKNNFKCPNCKELLPELIKTIHFGQIIKCKCGLELEAESKDTLFVKSNWFIQEGENCE